MDIGNIGLVESQKKTIQEMVQQIDSLRNENTTLQVLPMLKEYAERQIYSHRQLEQGRGQTLFKV